MWSAESTSGIIFFFRICFSPLSLSGISRLTLNLSRGWGGRVANFGVKVNGTFSRWRRRFERKKSWICFVPFFSLISAVWQKVRKLSFVNSQRTQFYQSPKTFYLKLTFFFTFRHFSSLSDISPQAWTFQNSEQLAAQEDLEEKLFIMRPQLIIMLRCQF